LNPKGWWTGRNLNRKGRPPFRMLEGNPADKVKCMLVALLGKVYLLMGVKCLWVLSMPLFDLKPKNNPEELFGRRSELEELVRLVSAGRWVAVLGPRMVGKTSLIRAANVLLENSGFKTVYVNLWGVSGVHGLLGSLARGISSSRGLLDKIRDAAGMVEGVSVGSGGVSISVSRRPMATVGDLLSVIGRLAGKCVIELDEIQELASISGLLLKVLANIFNTYPNIVFVFTGSMFGLMRTLLEPGPSSPLYGRTPAKLVLKPFRADVARSFLETGFAESNVDVESWMIDEAVEKLDGVPGWLTLYGNNVVVREMPHHEALEETVSEGVKIVKGELEHFLEGRDRRLYMAALKAAAIRARWSEVKGAIEAARGIPVNDATVYKILKNLKAAMLIEEQKKTYTVRDPMLRTLLLAPS